MVLNSPAVIINTKRLYLSVTTVSRIMSSYAAYAKYLSHSSYVSISDEIRPV